MRYLTVLLALSLAACAPTLMANQDGGIVRKVGAFRQEEAFKLASDHCTMQGKAMRIVSVAAFYGELSFICVAS